MPRTPASAGYFLGTILDSHNASGAGSKTHGSTVGCCLHSGTSTHNNNSSMIQSKVYGLARKRKNLKCGIFIFFVLKISRIKISADIQDIFSGLIGASLPLLIGQEAVETPTNSPHGASITRPGTSRAPYTRTASDLSQA